MEKNFQSTSGDISLDATEQPSDKPRERDADLNAVRQELVETLERIAEANPAKLYFPGGTTKKFHDEFKKLHEHYAEELVKRRQRRLKKKRLFLQHKPL